MRVPQRVNRWLYLAICLFGGVLLAATTGVSEDPIYLFLANLLVFALTHPAGLLAQAVSLPLIYTGIATQAEAFLAALPLAVAMGYLQWYVVVPWLMRRRPK